jgi:hypothetical protein
LLIHLNWHILALTTITITECVLGYSDLVEIHTFNIALPILDIFKFAFGVVRSCYSRFLLLLIALGYSIAYTHILKHHSRIGVFFFFYGITLISRAILSIDTTLLNLVMNIILFVWILISFKQTIRYLTDKKEDYKVKIMNRMRNGFFISTAL